jgi:hypothetical protein
LADELETLQSFEETEMSADEKFVQYEHHGKIVWVFSELKGLHRQHCLCHFCEKFNPGIPEENCLLANLNFAVCLQTGMLLPVYECPEFVENPGGMIYP